jgi:iron complex outermembrane receptor protein
MLGVAWRVRPATSVFVNWTSAFETPTITELTNQDNGAAGLNSQLLPQTTRTIETGLQSLIGSRVRVDLAAFRAIVHDELVPFDVPNQAGRRAFRNAGQTSRTGFESSVVASLPWFDVGGSYTKSHFRFDRYVVGTVSYAGKAIPGIPSQVMQLWTTVRAHDAFATVEATLASRMTADDAATVNAAGYAVWSLRGGYSGNAWLQRVGLEPTAGIDNLFDRHYAPSVVINATRSRYFEPGLTRRVFVSMRVNAHR